MKQKVTARLEGWSYDPLYKVFWGWIFGDIHKRWPDNTYIHTSHCPLHDAKKGDVVKTLNNDYLLGEPSGFKQKSN